MKKNNEYLLTGGTGTLGKELIKIFNTQGVSFVAPSSAECNVLNEKDVDFYVKNSEQIIHAAAKTDVKRIEKNPEAAIDTNVTGTTNVLKACMKYNKKIIFISTDHVFDGKKGNYSIFDYINPISKYAKTKAAAEMLVRTYENHMIIRTSFFDHTFPYENAFVNQWSSKDYIDIIAPKIFNAIISNKQGIVHIGSQRRTLYDIALSRDNDREVKKAYREEYKLGVFLAKDYSLNTCEKQHKLLTKEEQNDTII
jgi:dTDP-4-dehydrorhamnose reductase